MSNNDYIAELLLRALDGNISREEFETLQNKIINDPAAQDYYYEFLTTYIGFTSYGCLASLAFDSEDQVRNFNLFLDSLAEGERTAPAIDLTEGKLPQELIQEVVYPPREKRKINKLNIFTLVFSAAAVLFLALFLKLTPLDSQHIIARVSQAVDAEWLSTSGPIAVGDGLYPGPLVLKKGFAEVVFGSGAKVLLQAPVDFQLETPSCIYLAKGQLVANIEQSTEGRFVVRTAHSTVVDYGTEFGVEVDEMGQTNAHVFKGKVELRQGSDPLKYESKLSLEAGQSGMADSSGKLDRVAAQPQRFITTMPNAYELAVIATKPLYYWRFDQDKDGRLLDEINPQYTDESKLFGSVGYTDGPNLGGGENRALQLTGREEGYAVLRQYAPEFDDADSFSTAMWIRPQGKGTEGDPIILSIGKEDNPSARNRYKLMFNNDSKIFTLFVGNLEKIPADFQKQGLRVSSNPVQLDTWYHVAVTYTNSQRVNLYLNGRLEASEKLLGAVRSLGSIHEKYPIEWYIGTKVSSPGNSFAGSVDEVSQYNRELSAEEVRMLYEAANH
jgi:hypothetical protein